MESTEVVAIKSNQQRLLELVNEALANPEMTRVVSETTANDFAASPSAVSLLSIIVPFNPPKPVFYQKANGQKQPAVITQSEYNVSVFESRIQETFGDLVEGRSIYNQGYEIMTNADGTFVEDELPNPLLEGFSNQLESGAMTQEEYDAQTAAIPITIRRPRLIDTDEDGNPIPPMTLMVWRPQFGWDATKQAYTQLTGEDTIIVVANRGVPRKTTTTVVPNKPVEGETEDAEAIEGLTEQKVTQRNRNIDWAVIPNLQKMLINPLLKGIKDPNTAIRTKWQTFVSGIPKSPNAPSKKKAREDAGKETQGMDETNKVVAGLPGDQFAQLPQDPND